MKSDSFENFNKYKDLINNALVEFVSNFENESNRTKELLHYQSTINLSKEISRFNNTKANYLKELMIEYMEIIKDIDVKNDTYVNDINDKRKKSLELYKKYLYPVGNYLISKSEIKPGLPLIVYSIIGIIFDFIIYKFFSKSIVPLATVLITFLGFIRENQKRKRKKMFLPYY